LLINATGKAGLQRAGENKIKREILLGPNEQRRANSERTFVEASVSVFSLEEARTYPGDMSEAVRNWSRHSAQRLLRPV
jgi:hypothetical protein